MSIPLRRKTVTFIVRVWAEYLEQPAPVWRGEIEPVGGGEVMHFSGLSEIDAAIEKSLASFSGEKQEGDKYQVSS